MSPRRLIRLLLRVLCAFLLLDILLLAGWLWKGPDLLSPLIPRILALSLPNVFQTLHFEQAGLDRRGVVFLRNVSISHAATPGLKAFTPELRASLSFASLKKWKPVFARLEMDSVSLHVATDSIGDPLVFADSLLEHLRVLPDTRAFINARIHLSTATVLNHRDTLGLLHDLRLQAAEQADTLFWSLHFAGRLQYHPVQLKTDEAHVRVAKAADHPFWLDSLDGNQLKLQYERSIQNLHRDSLLALVVRPFNYAWTRHLADQTLALDHIVIQSENQTLLQVSSFQLKIGAQKKAWKLQGSLQGQLGPESIHMDSVQVFFHLPDTLGVPEVDSLQVDSLHVSGNKAYMPVRSREDAALLLRNLGRHPFWKLLEQGNWKVRTASYDLGPQSHARAEALRIRRRADSVQVQVGAFAFSLQNEGISGNSMRAVLRCEKQDPYLCRFRVSRMDSLHLFFQNARIAQGPAQMMREWSSWYKESFWRLFDESDFVIPYMELSSSSGFTWKFSEAAVRVAVAEADSVLLQMRYRHWRLTDSALINGWMLRQLSSLSKGNWHRRNLGNLLDTLDFQDGNLQIRLRPAGYEVAWESGLNAQTRARVQTDFNLDMRDARPRLSGKLAVRGFSLAQTFPLLFDQAFAQGLRASGTIHAQGSFQIPLSGVNRLENFLFQGNAGLHGGAFQGLHLQKQSLIRSKAPPFTGSLPFDELRLEGLTLDGQGIHVRHIAGSGKLFDFTGWLSARYDASFYLHAQAHIPPATARQLPTLTRNGMEQASDGGRQAKLIVYGTLLRQELSNQGKLVNRAILNNLKSGFGLFRK